MIDFERFIHSSYFKENWQGNENKPAFTLIPLQQEAPSSVRSFHVKINGSEYFAKIYIDNMPAAERELLHNRHLQDLPFFPQLLHTSQDEQLEKRIFVYEYLSGKNLHEVLTESSQKDTSVNPSIITTAIDQISIMSHHLHGKNIPVPETPWALKSPVRTGFITDEEHQQFLSDYQDVLKTNLDILQMFPGFYFDRNTRNVLSTSNGIYQVDVGVLEYSSQLFDLAKLLRNGSDRKGYTATDIPNARWNTTDARTISAITPEEESGYLDYAYDVMQGMSNNYTGTREDFKQAFEYAGLHAHVFYLTKYSKLLREGIGSNVLLPPRAVYHYASAYNSLSRLTGEINTQSLYEWMDYFALRSQG